MRVYLVQHAEAVSKEQDPARPLTPRGFRETEAVGRLLAPLELGIAEVWHSGKLRAEQTAGILHGFLAAEVPMVAHAGLLPKDAPGPLADLLETYVEPVLAVGHQPQLGRLAARMLGLTRAEAVRITRGGVLCLERGPEGWELLWSVTPAIALAQGAAPAPAMN